MSRMYGLCRSRSLLSCYKYGQHTRYAQVQDMTELSVLRKLYRLEYALGSSWAKPNQAIKTGLFVTSANWGRLTPRVADYPESGTNGERFVMVAWR
jgi:hypothetical protein